MILSPYKLFVEKCRETTIVNCSYLCLCYQSRIFEMFLVVFLQKFSCFLYFYLSSWDLFLKKLLRNLNLFIMFLHSFFLTKRGFICSKIFLFDCNMFIKYIKYCFLWSYLNHIHQMRNCLHRHRIKDCQIFCNRNML